MSQEHNQVEQIFESLQLLMHSYRHLQYQVLKQQEATISHQEYKALGFFKRNPGSTLTDLVEHSGRDKAQITRIIQGLRNKALLISEPNSHDKRSSCLRLSEVATAMLSELETQTQQLDYVVLERLTEVEKRQFLAMLNNIRSGLKFAFEEKKA